MNRIICKTTNNKIDKCWFLCYIQIMDAIKKNETYTVSIDGYTSEALGVCHIDGRAVFVPGAIPGELWRIRILKVTSNSVYAKGEELLSPSPARIESDCPYYGKCGGCDTRHMSYAQELDFKLGRVNDALKRIGKQSFTVKEIIGSDSIARYRNKGIFAVADVGGVPSSGFFRERSHDLIPVEQCLIQNELTERTAKAVTDFMTAHGIPAYNEQTGKGTVRHIFCREAVNSKDAVACIISARGFGGLTNDLAAAVRNACPELTGIVLNINKTVGNTVLSGDFYTLWGKAEICDTLCGLKFNIAPQAFYQINPPQAEKLYRKALEYASPAPDSLVFDLYCGAGTISLTLAGQAGKVIGAEIVPEAIENAKRNAQLNGIDNAEFICADAGAAAADLAKRGLKPDVIVVDPPRKGMSEDAVKAVSSMQPERIVYVSCDPSTLARDILRFNEYGYTLSDAAAVDMFPRTRHVESVVLLSRA